MIPGSVTRSHPRTTRPSVHTGKSSVMHIGTYWSDPWTGPKILVFKPLLCIDAVNASECLKECLPCSGGMPTRLPPPTKLKHCFAVSKDGRKPQLVGPRCTLATQGVVQAIWLRCGAHEATTQASAKRAVREVHTTDLRKCGHNRRIRERQIKIEFALDRALECRYAVQINVQRNCLPDACLRVGGN